MGEQLTPYAFFGSYDGVLSQRQQSRGLSGALKGALCDGVQITVVGQHQGAHVGRADDDRRHGVEQGVTTVDGDTTTGPSALFDAVADHRGHGR